MTNRSRAILQGLAGALACATLASAADPLPAPHQLEEGEVPPPPAPSGDFPDASTTGVPPGVTLSASGSVATSNHGQVIQNLDINGCVLVQHDDVVIRNSRVRCGGGAAGIEVATSVDRLLVEDSEIEGPPCGKGVRTLGGSYALRRVEIRNAEDGAFVGGHDILIEDSWIHSLNRAGCNDPHNDGVQTCTGYPTRNVAIRHNRIEALFREQTSAVMIQACQGTVDGVQIEDNWLSGGTYTLYVEDKGAGAPANVKIRSNTWHQDSWKFGPRQVHPGPGYEWSGNLFSTGAAFP